MVECLLREAVEIPPSTLSKVHGDHIFITSTSTIIKMDAYHTSPKGFSTKDIILLRHWTNGVTKGIKNTEIPKSNIKSKSEKISLAFGRGIITSS